MRRHNRTPDREYLDFIRSLPCVICLANAEALSGTEDELESAGARGQSRVQKSPTEAAHVGERGLMQKCSDRETAPLCAEHHREGKYSAHKLGVKFWSHHGLSKLAVIAALQSKFESKAEVMCG